MILAIIIIVAALAIFLIFRNEHDGSYNKNERGLWKDPKAQSQPQQKTQYQTESGSAPKAGKQVAGPTLKDQILDGIEQAISEAKKGWDTTGPQTGVDDLFPEDEEELDLLFLDDIGYSDDLEENTETFDIIGLRHYCTVHDAGKIVGIVKPEPSNVHDSRAQAVYRNDGKLLGYIPRTQLDWYEDFNEQNVHCPFVGKIEVDGRGWLIAEIKVIIPSSREYVEKEIEDEL